jgi:hypothetical protein
VEVPFDVISIDGGKEVGRDGRARRVDVSIPADGGEWIDRTLTVKLGKRVK